MSEQLKNNPYAKIEGAVDPAKNESSASGLPGIHNGPGDAYRHVIGAAEITRRFGETTARIALEGHELEGFYSGKQPLAEAVMDRHNNEIGIQIGREAKNLDEVIDKARAKIDSAAQGEKGPDVPTWLPEDKWRGSGANWPPEWENPEKGDYNLGGEEHRYPGWRDEGDPAPGEAPGELNEILGRPVETWGEEDVTAVMKSDAYWRSWDPDYQALHGLVGRWHEHFYGDGPVMRDERGDIRPIRPIPARVGGPVFVRAHERDGVAVRAHERSRPG